jgi:hypothetical protein
MGVVFSAVGSVIYCVIGGLLMTGFHEKDNHPQHFFIFSAMVGALIFIAACIYPKSSESPPESHDHGSHSH